MFVCFAPRENPKIAVAVVIQNAGFGATWAGRIGSLLVEKYLRDTLTAERVKLATDNCEHIILLPGYLVRLQFITDSVRVAVWAKQNGDSTRWKQYQDPSFRRQMLDTLNRPSSHVVIPFGPRAQVVNPVADSSRTRKTDSVSNRKTDSSGKSKKIILNKTNDSAALIPKEPVVQKDSNSNQTP